MNESTRNTNLLRLLAFGGVIAAAHITGCTRHTIDVQPIRIEPIYMTIDVNVKVDRELDEFFDYKEKPQLPTDLEPASPPDLPPPTTEGEQP